MWLLAKADVDPDDMNGSSYYAYQAKARGLRNNSDVDGLVREMVPVYRRLLGDWLPDHRRASVYEVACGPGIFLRYLMAEGYVSVSGSDSSECQIGLARQAGLNVFLGDSIQELARMGAGSVDCVVGIDFIEHLPKDVLILFFEQAFRVLAPGGVLILRAPNGDSPFVGRNLFNDITHYWAYTSVATRALLQMVGFGSVDFHDDSEAMLQRHRWFKVPAMRMSRLILRLLIRMAVREDVAFLGPNLFVYARKAGLSDA